MATYQQYFDAGDGVYFNPITNDAITEDEYNNLVRYNSEPVISVSPDIDIIRDYMEQRPSLSFDEALDSQELQAILIGLEDNTGEYTSFSGKKLYPPDSPKARALILLGRRSPESDWAVGETPTQ